MLEKLFKSKTLVGILKTLMLNESLHIREIARRIGITPIYVKKELSNLWELGIAEEERKGNLSLWRLNKKSSIYKEIKQIFLKTDLIANHLIDIVKYFNPTFAFVYGSFASGKESQSSDIDLFIIGEIPEDKFLVKLSSFEQEVNREINYILWTEQEFKKRAIERHHLLQNIGQNPIIWIWGNEDEFRRLVKGKVD